MKILLEVTFEGVNNKLILQRKTFSITKKKAFKSATSANSSKEQVFPLCCNVCYLILILKTKKIRK